MRTAKILIRLGECPGWSESFTGITVTLFALSCRVSYSVCSRSVILTSWQQRLISFHEIVSNKVWNNRQLSRLMTKPTKWHCAQRRPRSDWASSLSAWRKLGSLATHWAHSEDSDQTERMPRLICVFAGRKVILLVLSWGGSIIAVYIQQLVSGYFIGCT